MADDDVGGALTGFERYMSPRDVQWGRMRRRTDIDLREEEPWPTVALPDGRQALPQTITGDELSQRVLDRVPEIPPITSRLQQAAGTGDVGPLSKEEVLKFILDVDAHNPLPERVPLPRKRPDRRK